MPFPSQRAWRTELFKLAVEAGYDITYVGTTKSSGPDTVAGKPFPKDHEGVSGQKIADLDRNITGSSPAQGAPHLLLVHIGTNDALEAGISGGTMGSRLETLLDDFIDKSPDTLIAVASLVPLEFGSGQSVIDAYNALIPGIVQSRADAYEYHIC